MRPKKYTENYRRIRHAGTKRQSVAARVEHRAYGRMGLRVPALRPLPKRLKTGVIWEDNPAIHPIERMPRVRWTQYRNMVREGVIEDTGEYPAIETRGKILRLTKRRKQRRFKAACRKACFS